MLTMEIYSKNGDCKAKSGDYLEQKHSSARKGEKHRAPQPPKTELPSSTLPVKKTLSKCNSTPVIHQHFSEFTYPLVRTSTEVHWQKLARKSFLRPTEHILATFYGLVFIIEGPEWHILKSEHLPIYFVRVSVKNVKYPFRILVIDNESENHIRVIDFIVSCKTKTSIKEEAVCWQDQEIFGAKFSNKSQAFQFYDTISRMTSTLRKGKELEKENLDKMVDLQIHLPNSEVRNYQFLKTDKLKDALKFVCNKEKLHASDYYFHHMALSDDSLNMVLKVGDVRTDRIRLVSKSQLRRSSTDVLEKVSMPISRKKNAGMFSLFRRRFSRKGKESPQYSSAPSVIQYTDNVFMVERQSGDQINDENRLVDSHDSPVPENFPSGHFQARATKSDTSDMKSISSTHPKHVKRKAPQPPKLIIPKAGQTSPDNHGVVVNGDSIGGRKMTKKRRAPSPPRIVGSPDATGNSDGVSPKQAGTKPPRPFKPPSITTSPTGIPKEPHNVVEQTSGNAEKKTRIPVFIAPPPPDSTPPPIDECETPVGPIDSEQDDGSVEIPVEISGIIDDTKSLDLKSSENREDEIVVSEVDASKEVEVKVELDSNERSGENENEDIDISEATVDNNEEEPRTKEEEPRTKEEDETEEATNVAEVKHKIDGGSLAQNDEEKSDISYSKEDYKLSKVDENENSLNQENIKNLTPEQLQALILKNSAMNPQDPLNLQNQQLFAMQQNQQMLSNILLQQMLQQQMQAQRPPTMLPMTMGGVLPVAPFNAMPLAGGASSLQPAGMIPPVGTVRGVHYPAGIWPQVPPLAQPVPQPVLTHPAETPPSESKQTDEVKTTSTTATTTDLPKIEEKPEPSSETETKSKAVAAVKEEELVNRPLFKKMLAQVSQGKLQGIPKTPETGVKPTSPVSPTAKIAKVPTSYVASAEKNVPQAKPVEDKVAPVSLGDIGRKSSYVESAMDRQKIDSVAHNNVNVAPKISENTAVSSSTAKAIDATISKPTKLSETSHVEKTSQATVLGVDSASVSTIVASAGSSIKQESPNLTSNDLPPSTKVAVENTTSGSANQTTPENAIDTRRPTSTTLPPKVEIPDKVSLPSEQKSNPVVINDTPSHIDRVSDTPKPTPPISPPNLNVTDRVSALPGVDNERKPTSAIICHTPSEMHRVSDTPTHAVNHKPPYPAKPPVTTPKPPTPTHRPNVAPRPPAQTTSENRSSHMPNSTSPSQVTGTSRKLVIEEPALGIFNFPGSIVPPLSTRLNESKSTPTEKIQNSSQLSFNHATIGTRKVEKPVVARKPRHMSEPKPTVASKPTYEIRQSKTLPKTKKKHIQISLSLTPEERMQLPKSSGISTNVAGGK